MSKILKKRSNIRCSGFVLPTDQSRTFEVKGVNQIFGFIKPSKGTHEKKFFANSVRCICRNDQMLSEQTLPISKDRDSKPNTRNKNASIKNKFS